MHPMKSIGEVINQKKFDSPKHKAHINILYTASYASSVMQKALKPLGISPQQYNILRILKGQSPRPASVKLLTERMLDKMSNASRLVEKLKLKGLVDRVECETDRRQVNVELTAEGLKLLTQATLAINESMNYMNSLTDEEANLLSDLLDKTRG
jgi:DNA-binding MarR family transcriptional regulator